MQLSIIVPCYNEEEVLKETSSTLISVVEKLIISSKIDDNSAVYFVDDGSKDNTWSIIKDIVSKSKMAKGIKLSHNSGHQNALLAGLFTAKGDIFITIDADLQDDVDIIEQMVDEYRNGSEIVYGIRNERKTDTLFKRITAESFYKVMRIMGVEIVFNHADYRLLSRTVIEYLKEYKEVNIFLRAIIPLLGFRSANVYYNRSKRFAGESKYPLKKMLSFAWDGITSFSVMPLRIITVMGFLLFFASLFMSFWILGTKLFTDTAIPGWASTVLPIYFIGGIQIFSLGVVGEYIGKIYLETKQRPRYIIEKTV